MASEAAISAATGEGGRLQRRVSKTVARPLFWIAVVLFGLAIPLLNQMRRPPEPKLAVLGTLPPFLLTADDGQPFGTEQLSGKVWLAGFIFTRCPTICPAITATMSKVQKRARGIEQDFRMVSFSVDPEYDTPAVVNTYARAHGANPRLWKFLTGPLDAIEKTVVDGLKISMGKPEGQQDFASIFHGTHFVLVDRAMQIRGYYDSNDANVVDTVLHDAAMLLNRGD